MIRMIPALMFTLVAVLLFVALVMQPNTRRDDDFSGALVGQAVPALALADADSSDAPLDANALSGKVTVINFFASWCTPCAQEMGELVALKKSLPGVQFIGVAWNDGPDHIRPWLKRYGNPFDQLRYDPNGRAAIALGMRGIPESFVIDSQGVVRYQVAGALTASSRAELATHITALLKEPVHAR